MDSTESKIITTEVKQEVSAVNSSASAQSTQQPPSPPYNATKSDGIFSIFCLFAGMFYVRWGVFIGGGWGTALFTFAFAAGILAYFYSKGVKLKNKESIFWLCILLLTGLSYAVWPVNGLLLCNILLLHVSLVYFCVHTSGVLIEKKTGSLIILDLINAFIAIPLRNFFVLIRNFAGFKRQKNAKEIKESTTQKKLKISHVIFGVLMAIIALLFILPLLAEADGGTFASFFLAISTFFAQIALPKFIMENLFYMLIGLPVAFYVCALISGCAHKRKTANFNEKDVRQNISILKIMPRLSIYILLGTVCLIYAIFIFCQLSYFFSAFGGGLPQGYSSYSDYARQGFFELCTIAVINILILIVCNVFARRFSAEDAKQQKPLIILNIVLSALTMLLIVTAFSKMALYIYEYGLTQKRIITSVFLIFLFAVFIGIIVLQFKSFNISRFALLLLSGLFCITAISNIDGIIAGYNAKRIINGTLSYQTTKDFSNEASIPAAVKLLQSGILLEGEQNILQDRVETSMENINDYYTGFIDNNFYYAYLRKNYAFITEK